MPEAPAPGPLLQSGYHACHQTGYEVASLTDLLPTIAEATGANVPSDLDLDVYSLTWRLLGTPESRDLTYFYHSLNILQAVRRGAWKLVLPRQRNDPELLWLAQYTEEVPEHQLYNLDSDLSETRNMASQFPDVVAQLLREAELAKKHL